MRASANASWELAWSAQASAPAAFAADAQALMQSAAQGTYTLRQLPSPAELEEHLTHAARLTADSPGSGPLTLAGVVLADEADPAAPKVCSRQLKVTLRFPSELRKESKEEITNWMTDHIFPEWQSSSPRDNKMEKGPLPSYANEGFAGLQALVSRAVAERCAKQARRSLQPLRHGQARRRRRREATRAAPGPSIRLRRFSYPPYDQDTRDNIPLFLIVFYMCFVFSFSCMYTVMDITNEKAIQIKETLKIMGVSTSLHWMAWFLKTMCLLIIIILIVVAIYKIPTANGAVLKRSSFFVVFILYVLFAAALTTYCFFMSTLSSNPIITSNVAALIYMVLILILWKVSEAKDENDDILLTKILLFCLTCVGGLGIGIVIILKYEAIGVGQQWSNLWSRPTPDFPVPMGAVWLMLLLSCLIFLLLALYVDAVNPGEFGVPRPWNFPCRKPGQAQMPAAEVAAATAAAAQARAHSADPRNFEAEPPGAKVGVRISGVTKVFRGTHIAVNNLNLNLQENQITVLLGHNGAGKTTTISMMTGTIVPTRGTVTVGQYDIRTDTQKARERMGICTQHNVLFEQLTVYEHVYFFSKLKGLSGAELKEDIAFFLKLLQLENVKNKKAGKLSGGMKRKLCVAIALCGKSKVVFLDEPTAGMDPAARRALWDVLMQQKSGRTLLLTTHMMEEADVLGDRIGIMAGGEMQSLGSPFFLKKRFSEGYHLVVVKGKGFNASEITKLLAKHVQNVKVAREAGVEVVYQLDEAQTARFEPMLADLEKNTSNLHVVSFGLSCTTMEEVYLKVSKKFEDSEGGAGSQRRGTRLSVVTGRRAKGCSLACRQVRAMCLKKGAVARRGWLLLVVHLLLPAVPLLLFLLLSMLGAIEPLLPALSMSLKSYTSPKTVIAVGNDSKSLAKNYQDLISDGDTTVLDGQSSPSDAFDKYMIDKYNPDEGELRQEYIIGASFEKDQMTGWFSDRPFHALPLALNMLYNAHLKSSDVSLNIVNHPLPFATESQVSRLQKSSGSVALTIVLGMSILSCFFILFPIRERSCKAKHNQMVAGVNVLIFWGVHFIFDLLCILVACVLVIIALVIIQAKCFSTDAELARIFAVLVCFGCESLWFAYVFSLMFKTPSTGYSLLTTIYLIPLLVLVTLPSFFSTTTTATVQEALMFIPIAPLYEALSNLEKYCTYSDLCSKLKPDCSKVKEHFCCPEKCPTSGCVSTPPNYFQWPLPGIMRDILFFLLWGFIYFAILLLIDSYLINFFITCVHKATVGICVVFSKKQSDDNLEEDDDVLNEKNKISSSTETQLKEYSVVLSGVTKYYAAHRAVNNISIGVEKGETFGLLGANGAGKTSTFKIMTGDTSMTKGKGYLMSYNLQSQIRQVHKNVGYCPQADALVDEMTIRETIRMYLLLRGYSNKAIRRETRRLGLDLKFTEHIDKKVKQLSGGNKRKLSLVIALIGEPPVMFLDEPTAGMDPGIRRHVWDTLTVVAETECSIILTSHSMEECEALCTRVAIMVNGNFKCLGPVQHLKNKFAKEITLIIKVKEGNNVPQKIKEVKDFIGRNFPGAALKQEYGRLLTYSVPSQTHSWSQMFGIMERAKKNLDLEDYTLGQTSLEQVFLHFTSLQGVDK